MTLGIQALRKRYGVGEHTVLGWIRSGEMTAVNVAKKTGTRPKWRVTQEDINAFELLRQSPTPTKNAP